MESRKTVFDLIGQIFTIFGFSVICLMVFIYLFGEDAEGYSTIFLLGNRGIALSILAQFLLTSTMVALFRQIYFTDIVIKNASLAIRTIGMFISVVVMIIIFVWLFGWFPMTEMLPWILFFVWFGICTGVSAFISVVKEKVQNKKMQEALERMQEGEYNGNEY